MLMRQQPAWQPLSKTQKAEWPQVSRSGLERHLSAGPSCGCVQACRMTSPEPLDSVMQCSVHA